jgi:hypothetical protein
MMDHFISTKLLLSSTLFFCTAVAANTDPCATFAPDATLSDQEQLDIRQACSSQSSPLSCMKQKTAEQYDLNYAAAIYSFLGSCKKPAHDNYRKAKKELALVDLSDAEREKKQNEIAATTPEQKKREAAKKAMADLPATQTTKPWLVTVSVGSQHLPDYQGGASNGLSKSQAFGEVIADYRSVDERKNEIHWGAFMSLEGQPVNNADAPNVRSIEFNDVANTLTTGIYYINMFDQVGASSRWSFFNPKEGQIFGTKVGDKYTHYSSKWGWGGKLSMRSRESLGAKKDAIDPIAEIGLHYRYDEHNGVTDYGNVMPKGTLSFGLGYWHNYEEYLAQDAYVGNRWRFLVRGEYRLSDEVPAYLGFKGNLGQGPDNLGVYLSLRMKSDKLLGLLTDEK